MKNLNFLKLFFGTMLLIVTATFASCVDDNDDTEAPFLEVSPTNLIFTTDGVPAEGSQSSFEISTNRHWTATVKDDKSWVTLSATEGDGTTTVQVSIPENINDEASIEIQIANKVGPLMTETVTIKSGDIVPTEVIYHETVGSTAVSSPYPYVDAYEGWTKTGTGAANVTYSGQKATVRASGLANNNPVAYEGASGPNVVFFGTLPADFTINDIALADGQTSLKLTFGASYSYKAEGATDYDNTFDPSKFTVSLSGDGSAWVPLTYTKNNGDEKTPYWVFATANFTLKQPSAKLYIKFTALAASAIRLDDITLSTGNGGQEIDLGNVTPPEPGETKPITIPELIGMMTATQTPVDATADRTFEAIVQSNTEGGNYTVNNLVLATEGATTAGNGITLFGSQVDPATLQLTQGDKVKVTLYKGLAKTVNYNGMYEVTGSKDDNWAKVEKLSPATTITPTIITADKLAEYQGMTVTIKNATPESAGIWGSADTHTFTAGGVTFAVFCKEDAPAFANQPFVKTESDITGLAAVYKNNSQLVPRTLQDVIGFNSNDPTIIAVTPSPVSFSAAGGTQVLDVEIANQGSNTISATGLSGILSSEVNGNKVTVTAAANESTDPVNQTLSISLTNGNTVTVPVSVSGQGSGNETVLTVDLTDPANYPSTFPKLKAEIKVEAQTFSFGGHDYVFAGSTGNGYYQAMDKSTPYIINGKQKAYIELPAIADKKLTKVTVTTRSGASVAVMVAIVDGSNTEVAGGKAIKWDQAGGNMDYTYNLTGTAVNTKYRIYISSAHNAQFTKWELTYE